MTPTGNVISFDRLDRVRQLEAEQARLARRLAELEFEHEQRIGDLERRVGERAVEGVG